jgi:group I intron endonuclease
MRYSGIYQIKNIVNDKVYIGSTTNLYERLTYHHYGRLKRGTHKNHHLQAAWNKYGEQSFEYSILELTQDVKSVLLEREKYYLDITKCFIRNFGYNKNMFPNSPLGLKKTEETKRKISLSMLGKPSWNKGNETPVHAKKKMSERKEFYKKKIEKVCPDSGLVTEYESLKDAERDGFHRYHVGECCRGIIEKHKGYFWKYKEREGL